MRYHALPTPHSPLAPPVIPSISSTPYTLQIHWNSQIPYRDPKPSLPLTINRELSTNTQHPTTKNQEPRTNNDNDNDNQSTDNEASHTMYNHIL